MNKDTAEGKLEQAKGVAKQHIGRATGDAQLHDEGVDDQAAGEVQEGVGKVKDTVGSAVKKVGDAIKN